jgi:hypothetical protein
MMAYDNGSGYGHGSDVLKFIEIIIVDFMVRSMRN